jgi:hypothetical protein
MIGKALTSQLIPLYNLWTKKRTCKTSATDWKQVTIDIGMISAAGFVLNCQDPDAILFSITFEEIDHEIQDQQVSEEATNPELVICRLLAEYQDLPDIFSQADSDKLPLYCTIDHKIFLEQENSLRFSLLYHMSLAELQTVKQYLLDNLNKGFIVLSQTLYASLVLFVKKPNRGLQFCIDY